VPKVFACFFWHKRVGASFFLPVIVYYYNFVSPPPLRLFLCLPPSVYSNCLLLCLEKPAFFFPFTCKPWLRCWLSLSPLTPSDHGILPFFLDVWAKEPSFTLSPRWPFFSLSTLYKMSDFQNQSGLLHHLFPLFPPPTQSSLTATLSQ